MFGILKSGLGVGYQDELNGMLALSFFAHPERLRGPLDTKPDASSKDD